MLQLYQATSAYAVKRGALAHSNLSHARLTAQNMRHNGEITFG